MNLPDLIKSDADLCVKCGLCLPHCPTYGKTLDEGESPRGRISLMQAMADGSLPPGGRLQYHLDRCLGCRACERACPSGVEYGRLLEASRALMAEGRQGARRRLAAPHRLVAGGGVARASGLLRLYQRSGAQAALRRTGLLRPLGLERMDRLLPRLAPRARWRPYYPATGEEHGRVALFTGCLGNVLEQDALHAAVALLNACGYGVHVPPGQACCGALHRHAGERAAADALARRNAEVFGALGIEAIVYTASGCGAALAEDSRRPGGEGAASPGLTVPVLDVCSLLDRIEWPAGVSFRPLAQRVLVHDPCSLRNVVRAVDAPYRLLRRIPGLDPRPLPGNERCCGGAGAYLLDQPDMADALLADKLDAIRQSGGESGAEILLTSNLGCGLQLGAGVRAAGMRVEVMHPVTLLRRQLLRD